MISIFKGASLLADSAQCGGSKGWVVHLNGDGAADVQPVFTEHLPEPIHRRQVLRVAGQLVHVHVGFDGRDLICGRATAL